jgi:hypothetical protein
MSQFKFTTASIVMLVGGVVILVGWIMPWLTVSLGGLGTLYEQFGGTGDPMANMPSLSGSNANLGMLVLLGALAVGGAGAAFAFMKPRYHMAWMVAGGAAAIVLLILVVNYGDISKGIDAVNASVQLMESLGGSLLGVDLSGVGAGIGLGFWLTGIGALIALAGAYLGYMEAKATAMPAAMPPAATAA